MTPEEFVARWRNTDLNERQTYQMHFREVCELMGVDPPTGRGTDAKGREFVFEKGVKKESSGGQGFADVFYEGHFAIEYKAPGKHDTLDDAYNQLKQYRQNLNNPPLLVVTDIERWEIHTNFNNAAHKTYEFGHEDIKHERARRFLNEMFTNPNKLHPDRTAADVTKDAAAEFAKLVDTMRTGLHPVPPERIAHFLTKVVFCLFAEDVGLLPIASSGRGLFTEIVKETLDSPSQFVQYMQTLFRAMSNGGNVLMREVRYFNGKLFEDVSVEELSFEALQILDRAAGLDWSSVEPAIFGTLFERSLDPAKRAQLGAHYTSPDDIMLIVEPVLMQPLRREWETIQEQARAARADYDAADNKREQAAARGKLEKLRERMLDKLRTVRVLDPACGSGNFLYMSLRALLDMEKAVLYHEDFMGVVLSEDRPKVHPRQMYGIEINPIAHDLATIVVWIGWIQWKINNGYPQYPEPVLQDLGQNVQQKDAILAFDADGEPTEPEWPEADVIVGNPPFLGDKKMRRELGDEYTDKLRDFYKGRVPGGADLVTYWFERARTQIEQNKVKRAGLLATNSIRQGANRLVLDKIKETGNIFLGWSDKEWMLEGAALNTSIVGFDDGTENHRYLDGESVEVINSDLTAYADVTGAKHLDENKNLCFLGVMKSGPFDIEEKTALELLSSKNPNGVSNKDVVKRRLNGRDITQRPSNTWIIDFGTMEMEEAKKYVKPFEYLQEHVMPKRAKNSVKRLREKWWLHARSRPAMRKAINGLNRFIATPEVAKYRVFEWLAVDIVPDHRLHVFAREDDYFFGVLHSKIHEVWTLATCSWIGAGNDPSYSSTTTFETFPFPWRPGEEDTTSAVHERISAAARALHTERAAWLNPDEDISKAKLKRRTLTNLYNALAKWRDPAGYDGTKTKPAADAFAPRLDELHAELDAAVCAAYGWPAAVLDDEEDMLRRLLALNAARA